MEKIFFKNTREKMVGTVSFVFRIRRLLLFVCIACVVLSAIKTYVVGGTRHLVIPKALSIKKETENLIIVPGHGVWKCCDVLRKTRRRREIDSLLGDTCWVLENSQKGGRSVKYFEKHIREGVKLLEKDPNALLVFSGGKTKEKAGPVSEAQSYWWLACTMGWYGVSGDVSSRAATEEYATDSYQNLLFSVCRFKEITGRYPRKITVVGLEFKRKRFVELHRGALEYPEESFFYVGIGFGSSEFTDSAYGLFKKDPHGNKTPELVEKREKRNPFKRTNSFAVSCPELEPLLAQEKKTASPYIPPWKHPQAK
ncbi:MAG: uncharacterized protein A8A55_1450 [Amphiamblys sp. WSBS2006]|nr:MAG: uncharacterized protein A8A55_1450 [Amphiamblys sp. WSBS2006]